MSASSLILLGRFGLVRQPYTSRYFNLTDSAYPIGFNVLQDPGPDERAVVADGIVAGMRAIWSDMWGPRLEQILRRSIMALIETPNASLALLPRPSAWQDVPFRVFA